MSGSAGDFIRRIATDQVIKSLADFHIQSLGSKDSQWFVGRVSADKLKITHPNGKVFDLKFSGQIQEYTLACKVSKTLAYAPGNPPLRQSMLENNRPRPVTFQYRGRNTSNSLVFDWKTGKFADVPIPPTILALDIASGGTSAVQAGFTPNGKHIWYCAEQVISADRVISDVNLFFAFYHNWSMTRPTGYNSESNDPYTFEFTQLEAGSTSLTVGTSMPEDPELPDWEDTWQWVSQSDPTYTFDFELEEDEDWIGHDVIKSAYGGTGSVDSPWPDIASGSEFDPSTSGIGVYPSAYDSYAEDGSSIPNLRVVYSISTAKRLRFYKRLKSIVITTPHSGGEVATASFSYNFEHAPKFWNDLRASVSQIVENNDVPHIESAGPGIQIWTKGNYTTPVTAFDLPLPGFADILFPPDQHQHSVQLGTVNVGPNSAGSEVCEYLRTAITNQLYQVDEDTEESNPFDGSNIIPLNSDYTYNVQVVGLGTSSSDPIFPHTYPAATRIHCRYYQQATTWKCFSQIIDVREGLIYSDEGISYHSEGHCQTYQNIYEGEDKILADNIALPFTSSKDGQKNMVGIGYTRTRDNGAIGSASGGGTTNNSGYIYFNPITETLGEDVEARMADNGYYVLYSNNFFTGGLESPFDVIGIAIVTDSNEIVTATLVDPVQLDGDGNPVPKIRFKKYSWNATTSTFVGGRNGTYRILSYYEDLYPFESLPVGDFRIL